MKLFMNVLLIAFLLLNANTTSYAQVDALMSVNVKDSPIKGVLELVAAKAGLQLVLDHDPNINVSLSQTGVTAKQILDKLSADQEIEYSINGNELTVIHRKLGQVSVTNARPGSGIGSEPHKIPIHFATALELATKISTVISSDEKLMVDDRDNSLVFIGSKKNLEKVQALVDMFDTSPKQIMIEAMLVETSHSFLQDLGVSIGDTSDLTLSNNSKITGYSTTAAPTTPNGSFKAILGTLDGRNLDLRITAAESKGDAKVVSRPKIITLNNHAAKIQSGITYHVKTLSSVPAGSGTASGSTGGMVTGGLTSVDAGLNVSILPTIVGDDQVKLAVDINNSQPDGGSAVDGIPGVLKNSANTLVIVKNKQTAVIAGLIKQNKSNSSTGVPFLSDIPILGLLFKSKSVQDTNDELVIFLTPSIQDPKAYSVDPTVMSNLDNNAAKDIKGVEIKTERVPASVKEVTATTAVVPSGAVPAIAPPVTQEPVTVSVEKNKK